MLTKQEKEDILYKFNEFVILIEDECIGTHNLLELIEKYSHKKHLSDKDYSTMLVMFAKVYYHIQNIKNRANCFDYDNRDIHELAKALR